jgi:hypothetical protein
MNRSWILVIGAFALVGCAHPYNLPGKYVSKDDFGVFVFRGDGSFGYKFPVKFDSYSEDNLKLRDGGKSFLLIREERLH